MDGIVIYKMSGSGNDFVLVDGRTEPVERWTPERVRAVCARGTGVGADGLVVLDPGSRKDAVRFHFFNLDGGRAPMCGNASLCSTRLAAWLEMASPEGMVLETDSGDVHARCLPGPGERAEIELPEPAELTAPDISLAAGERLVRLTIVGVPHLVVVVDDVGQVAVVDRGRELRRHPALGERGANVNFVSRAGSRWALRTYERGVEGETLACGTGSVASAATLALTAGVNPPLEVLTRSGNLLTVSASLTADRRLQHPTLAGEARLVFRAILGGG